VAINIKIQWIAKEIEINSTGCFSSGCFSVSWENKFNRMFFFRIFVSWENN
jgi:hypothetical protein